MATRKELRRERAGVQVPVSKGPEKEAPTVGKNWGKKVHVLNSAITT